MDIEKWRLLLKSIIMKIWIKRARTITRTFLDENGNKEKEFEELINGKVIRETYYFLDGQKKEEYRRNEAHEIIETILYYKNGKIGIKSKHKKRKFKSRLIFSEEGKLEEKHKYNNKGELMKKIYYYTNGKIREKNKYNNKGGLIKRTCYYANSDEGEYRKTEEWDFFLRIVKMFLLECPIEAVIKLMDAYKKASISTEHEDCYHTIIEVYCEREREVLRYKKRKKQGEKQWIN